MNVIIIEDEAHTAQDLADYLLELRPRIKVVKLISSVKEGLNYFNKDIKVDLIFSDIQLGDGLSFEIFDKKNTTVPVIFCTAYDRYAMDAFKANGVNYILKPFDRNSIEMALNQFEKLAKNFVDAQPNLEQLKISFPQKELNSTIIIKYKDQIIPIKIEDVAMFYIKNELCFLMTSQEKKYMLTESLDDLETKYAPPMFRVNRQYLMNKKTIVNANHIDGRKLGLKLKVNFDTEITVSKNRVTSFLNWLKS